MNKPDSKNALTLLSSAEKFDIRVAVEFNKTGGKNSRFYSAIHPPRRPARTASVRLVTFNFV